MADDTIERAALAAYALHPVMRFTMASGAFSVSAIAWDDLYADDRNRLLNAQRLAISTMREPDLGVYLAMNHPSDGKPFVRVDAMWRAGIDAALAPTGGLRESGPA